MRAIHHLLSRLPAPLGSLQERFDTRPIDTVEALTHFVHTRSAYVAQTSLHGYLKARMGTSFRYFFTDDEFSKSIRIASINVFLSCLADLTIFSVATAACGKAADSKTAAALAEHCYRHAAHRCLDPSDWQYAPDDVESMFAARAALANWLAASKAKLPSPEARVTWCGWPPSSTSSGTPTRPSSQTQFGSAGRMSGDNSGSGRIRIASGTTGNASKQVDALDSGGPAGYHQLANTSGITSGRILHHERNWESQRLGGCHGREAHLVKVRNWPGRSAPRLPVPRCNLRCRPKIPKH